jgi:hypothetical protein
MIPSALILEMHPAVRNLQARVLMDLEVACSPDGAEYFTDKLIEDIVTCLDQENYAIPCIDAYAASRKQALIEEGKHAEAQRVASEIVDFGRDLFTEFKDRGVYEKGTLNYVYTGRCTTRTLILSRFI